MLKRTNKKRKEPEDYTHASASTSSAPATKRGKKGDANGQQGERKPKNTAVYVTGLPPDTETDEVHTRFSKFGLIEEDDEGNPKIKLYARDDGTFSGDALVVYFKEESVDLAVTMLDDAELRIGEPEVQDIVGFLIVDGRIQGRIDQQAGTLEIVSDADADRIHAIQLLCDSVGDLYKAVFKDGDGFRSGTGDMPLSHSADAEGGSAISELLAGRSFRGRAARRAKAGGLAFP